MKEVIDIFGPNRTVRNRGVGGTEGHKEKKGPIVSYHKFVSRILLFFSTMIHNYITDFATQEKLEKTPNPNNHSQELWYSLHAHSSACDMKIKVIMEVEGIIS